MVWCMKHYFKDFLILWCLHGFIEIGDTTSISMEEGQDFSRQRWCQVVAYVNADAQMVDLDIPQPISSEIYDATCSAIYW